MATGPSPLRPGEYTIHDPPAVPPNIGTMSVLSALLLSLGALPLFIYPFVALADFMSLAGQPSGHDSPQSIHAAKVFIYSTLAYPLVLLASFLVTKNSTKRGYAKQSVLLLQCQ